MLIDISNTAPIRLRGWHYDGAFCKQQISQGKMIHILAETSNICDQDCEYCYTVLLTLDRPNFHSHTLPGELSFEEQKNLIDQAVALGAVSYDIVGAGEPLLDSNFLRQIEYAALKGLIPIVFTNGSILGHKTYGPRFAQRLWDLGASVVVKWHSANPNIHDAIVKRRGAWERADRAIQLLKQMGFNGTRPTRLGLDNIIYQRTIKEIPDCLRMCRRENTFLVCSTFIPSGRTQTVDAKTSSLQEVTDLYEKCRIIDEEEFGIYHSASMPYCGYGRTCTQYMGLYITIQGEIYGCVGQSEAYGNIRKRRLAEVWRERLPLLSGYDGGCLPRRNFYDF